MGRRRELVGCARWLWRRFGRSGLRNHPSLSRRLEPPHSPEHDVELAPMIDVDLNCNIVGNNAGKKVCAKRR
jgi:hypothetical protein